MKKYAIGWMLAVFSVMLALPAAAQTTINTGQTVSGLSGSSGNQKFYKINVPSGQTKLEIQTWGGSGDCDLYVKLGSNPSTSSYNAKSTGGSNSELITINNPSAGWWYILVRGYSTYSGASLKATYSAAASRVATPTFSPGGGTYSSAQNVTISCSTAGATIRYTTNGSEPTSSSTQHSGPITVNSTTTIKAKAFKSGMTESYTASATYTINAPSRVATPTFSPAGGTYSSAQNVTISCSTAGATIRYTTNGSDPTSSSTQYSGPITVNSTTTIKAKAFKSGMTESYTASASYTINAPSVTTLSNGQTLSSRSGSQGSVAHFKISVPSGQSSLVIKIWGGSGDCDLYVKRGSQASTSSYDYRPYLGGNDETVTVNSPASGDWYIMLHGFSAYSGLSLQATYAAAPSRVATPTFSPAGGTYSSAQNVTISCSTAGATIRYTTNGSEPTSSSTQYSGPITVNSTTTIKAKAFKSGMTDSETASATYTINSTAVRTLSNGQTVSGLSGSSESVKYYKIVVPSGQKALSVKISGGSGDCDVYVRYNELPTTSSYHPLGRPYLDGNLELVTIPLPASGSWYIMLRGYSSYSGLNLQAEYSQDMLTSSLLSGLSSALGYRLDQKYAQGRKPLAYLSAGWTYGIEISLTLYLDLADYCQVTAEGWNGDWITLWGRANGSAFGASALPVTLGVLEREFSGSSLPDREFPLEASIFGGSIGPLSVSVLSTSDLDFSPADISFTAVEANASVWAFSLTTPSVSAEIRRYILDSAIANSLTPGMSIVQSVNSMKTHLISSVNNNSSFSWALPVRLPSDKTDATP